MLVLADAAAVRARLSDPEGTISASGRETK
jgi:hypothetical protein